MTLFVLLFMIITTHAYIFSIPSYGWIQIRIRIFFIRIRIHQKVSDSFGFGFGSATLVKVKQAIEKKTDFLFLFISTNFEKSRIRMRIWPKIILIGNTAAMSSV
jgi:hypothetical protein